MSKVAVVGAGTMGHGIAQVLALAGYDTVLTDSNAAVLEAAPARIEENLDGGVTRGKITEGNAREAMSRIQLLGDLEAAVTDADLVIEAVIEDLGVKRDLFARLDSLTVASAVLATNTSSLSVAAIAAATTRPERVLGMHFFNPVHIMKLVELVRHDRTGDEFLARAREAVTRMGKQPIVVNDSPGFASSRLGVVLGLEAMRMVEQGVASPADIDKALELGYGHPMGPLKVSDLVGLDVRLAIADYLYQQLKQPHYEPPKLLREKVAAGELGKKTGKGFYEWPLKK
ncbi:MAG: 3-hydroxyacyl-CoA dehydrogenase family protein [Gemmatimonadetes bacterium]|nr:3-hydroxyacyl-CoA dehydrogenase family protein [Gemmatimonadota bacterium]MCH8936113.1 3-hydroxyacyl-CoA dehydrogenase family protein [Gemmatimonadota bacterium]